MESQQLLTSVVVPPVPVMAAERFAELVGVPPDVVRGWIDKGYIPTTKIGRWRLVNIALLTRESLTGGE